MPNLRNVTPNLTSNQRISLSFSPHFQEPQTKGWLFNSLVTHSLVYVVVIWAPRLPPSMWKQFEKQLVTMISHNSEANKHCHMTLLKRSLLYHPMLVETFFQLVVFIKRIPRQSKDRISRQGFKVAWSLYDSEYTSSWYSIVVSWFFANNLVTYISPTWD